MRHLRFILFCLLLPAVCWSQLKRVPIIRQGETKKQNSSGRAQTLTAMELPFWDDFSFTNSAYFANDTMWVSAQSAFISNGIGIHSPTLNVASFDGLDSLGKPYSVTDVLAKGYADKMISRPLRMDLITGTRRDSVFIYFMYQFEGHGEPPDPGDALTLWLKDKNNVWTNVWSVSQTSQSNDTVFTAVKIPIKDADYFFDNFQFQFRNFGRLSGPFDTWNLDYVYVSNGRNQYAPVYADFPDRAVSTTLTSYLKEYRSIPAKHFLQNPSALVSAPSFMVRNMRQDQVQPINFNSRYKISSRTNKVVTVGDTITLDLGVDGKVVNPGGDTTLYMQTLPDLTTLSPTADSIAVRLEVKINSGDNEKKLANTGDLDTLVYKNINFRYNDTTSTNYIFRNYYAYDDGVAEYAVSLTNPGNQIVYRFESRYSQPDTVVAVDIYFPHSGDESSQVIRLLVSDTLKNDGNNFDLTQDVVVTRTEHNLFTRVPLANGVLVKDFFYIGWIQKTFAIIGVGVDYSSDSGGRMLVNFSGAWESNQDVTGNLMIRPVFGNKTLTAPTAIIPEKVTHSYPNPNKGSFTIPTQTTSVVISDMMGKEVAFEQTVDLEKTEIRLSQNATGIYVLKYFDGTRWNTEKIMVLPQ